eukprot:13990937-Ditylum_brightwellii.AAC.1
MTTQLSPQQKVNPPKRGGSSANISDIFIDGHVRIICLVVASTTVQRRIRVKQTCGYQRLLHRQSMAPKKSTAN